MNGSAPVMKKLHEFLLTGSGILYLNLSGKVIETQAYINILFLFQENIT